MLARCSLVGAVFAIAGLTVTTQAQSFRSGWAASGNSADLSVPDQDLDVGPNHLVTINNYEIGFHKKATFASFYKDSVDGFNPGNFFALPATVTSDPEVFFDPTVSRWFAMQFARIDDQYGGVCFAVSDDAFPGDANDTVNVEGVWAKSFYSSLVGPLTFPPTNSSSVDSPDMAVGANHVFVSTVALDNFNSNTWDNVYFLAFNKSAIINAVPPYPASVTPFLEVSLTNPNIPTFPANQPPPLMVSTVVQKLNPADTAPQYLIESLEDQPPAGWPPSSPPSCKGAVRLRAFQLQTASTTAWEQHWVNVSVPATYCRPIQIAQQSPETIYAPNFRLTLLGHPSLR